MKCNKCGNEYDYRCEVCWPEKNGSVGKPQLCDVLAEIEEKEISGGALVRVKDVKEILSKYFA